MVERTHADDFIIHKSTFIVKNERKLDDVYKREKKVSVIGISILAQLVYSSFYRLSAKALMVRLVLAFIAKMDREELSRQSLGQRSRTGTVSSQRSKSFRLS